MILSKNNEKWAVSYKLTLQNFRYGDRKILTIENISKHFFN